MGCGHQTSFWKDVWLGECSLKIQFPRLFKICQDQEISVQAAAATNWELSYRRCFGEAEMEWRELMAKLEAVILTKVDDKVCWKLEHSGKFTTRSMYRFITYAGVTDVQMMEIWKAKIPLKVQIFLWMAWHDRIQTVQQLRRNWDKAQVCKFCGQEESVDHLLFKCPVAVAIWCWVRDSLGWNGYPTSISSLTIVGRVGGVKKCYGESWRPWGGRCGRLEMILYFLIL